MAEKQVEESRERRRHTQDHGAEHVQFPWEDVCYSPSFPSGRRR